jgi:hypothetical protein
MKAITMAHGYLQGDQIGRKESNAKNYSEAQGK